MKVHITTTAPIGQKCFDWAKDNLPEGVELVSDMNDSEIFISVFYNKLIPMEFIESRKKCLNFHGGVLPEYRGSGTLNFMLLQGEKEAGITLHEIDEKIDHGPVIEIRKFPIEDTDTTVELFVKAEATIFEMFKDWFGRLVAMDYVATPQDHSKAKLYSRKDLQAAKDLTRYARAYHTPPYEQAYYLNKKGEKIHLIWE